MKILKYSPLTTDHDRPTDYVTLKYRCHSSFIEIILLISTLTEFFLRDGRTNIIETCVLTLPIYT